MSRRRAAGKERNGKPSWSGVKKWPKRRTHNRSGGTQFFPGSAFLREQIQPFRVMETERLNTRRKATGIGVWLDGLQDLPNGFPISEEDWKETPSAVRLLVLQQHELIIELTKRVGEMEARLGQNSQNSNRPPSSDRPDQRAKRESKGTCKPGAKEGHKGHQQSLLAPTKEVVAPPKPCGCGCQDF